MSYGYSVKLVSLNHSADGRLLGVRLGRVCIDRDIPVAEIAADLGVTRQTVYNWFVVYSTTHHSLSNSVEKIIKRLQK